MSILLWQKQIIVDIFINDDKLSSSILTDLLYLIFSWLTAEIFILFAHF